MVEGLGHRRQRSIAREYLTRTCHVVSGLPPTSALDMSDRAVTRTVLLVLLI